jgi:signal transduction histidine kinase
LGVASMRRSSSKRAFLRGTLGASIGVAIAGCCLGIVAVVLGRAPFIILPAVVAPVIAVHLAYRGWVRETEKARESFLTTISHELRTPLTPIIGFAKFLLRRDEVDPTTRREALASLLERAEHMQRLVEDLLLAASVGSRRSVHARREPVDLVEVVARAVASARVSYPDRELRFEPGSPILAVGDAVRIRQVVANLVDNAVKYSRPNTPVVVRLSRAGDHAVIDVTDRGKGIPSDKLGEIFGKFRRLEDPDRMETGGPGLGLYIVDELVRAMGGTVTVESLPGRGSTFSVRLEAMAGSPSDPRTAHVERSA